MVARNVSVASAKLAAIVICVTFGVLPTIKTTPFRLVKTIGQTH